MKKFLLALFFLLLVGLGEVRAAIYYAATNGVPSNTGAFSSPWDLWTAGHKTNTLVGGDFILLLEGAYTNSPQGYITNANSGSIFEFLISGGYQNNITIMPYSNSWVILDGRAFGGPYKQHTQDDSPSTRSTLKIGNPNNPLVGHNLTFIGLEIMSSSTETRFSVDDSAFPVNLTRGDGVNVHGQSNVVANCYIHDLLGGLNSWGSAGGTIAYGNTIYNNGWMGTVHRHGHNMYTQSFTNSQPRYIGTNFLFNPYDNNYQAFGSSAAFLVHYRISGNTCINGDTLLGGRTDVVTFDNQITGNFHFNSDLAFIYNYGPNYGDVKITDNYLYGSKLQGGAWSSAIVTNNTVISYGGQIFDLITSPVGNILPWTVDRNRFHAVNPLGTYFVDEGFAPVNFNNWKVLTGYELNSQMFPLPTTNYIITRKNLLDTEKCNVVVYNYALISNVITSVSTPTGWGLTDLVRVRNVQNPLVDIVTNNLVGGSLTISMDPNSHTIAIPLGTNQVIAPLAFPNFGAFLVERLGSTNTRTIFVSSIVPFSGVIITNSPVDLNSVSQVVTPGSLSCLFSDTFTLSAPSTALVTNVFQKWDKNGSLFSTNSSITFTVTGNDFFTAVYAFPSPSTNNFNLISRRRPF
jgi:hypothetical protein